jgi:glycosyltransferase involved in cell wall biosynthesis
MPGVLTICGRVIGAPRRFEASYPSRPAAAPNPARHFISLARTPTRLAGALVTVVVPAYNAAAVIDETLLSVRGQSHRALEILVVDDGSKDATAQIVEAHAAEDPRVRLIRQSNGGVAAARNRGIAEARGEFIAPVDADDLWRWDKVERQLAAFEYGGERIGLVYTWYARIGADGSILSQDPVYPEGEDLLEAIATRNFVGNGSSPMFRKSVAEAIGGYDPSLRARKAQGCEDWRFYFQVAERSDFAVAPEYLVGYRQLPGAMSSDLLQMLRSGRLCIETAVHDHPELRGLLKRSQQGRLLWMFSAAIHRRSPTLVWALMTQMYQLDPLFLMRVLAALPWMVVRKGVRLLLRRSILAPVYFQWAPEP